MFQTTSKDSARMIVLLNEKSSLESKISNLLTTLDERVKKSTFPESIIKYLEREYQVEKTGGLWQFASREKVPLNEESIGKLKLKLKRDFEEMKISDLSYKSSTELKNSISSWIIKKELSSMLPDQKAFEFFDEQGGMINHKISIEKKKEVLSSASKEISELQNPISNLRVDIQDRLKSKLNSKEVNLNISDFDLNKAVGEYAQGLEKKKNYYDKAVRFLEEFESLKSSK